MIYCACSIKLILWVGCFLLSQSGNLCCSIIEVAIVAGEKLIGDLQQSGIYCGE